MRLTVGKYLIKHSIKHLGGKFHTFKRKVVYFVVGSWCLAAFVLVCAYNSVLISYILGSNAEALVNSIEELAENPNVKLVIDKGFGVDVILSVKSYCNCL